MSEDTTIELSPTEYSILEPTLSFRWKDGWAGMAPKLQQAFRARSATSIRYEWRDVPHVKMETEDVE